jgi:hypothetical protein
LAYSLGLFTRPFLGLFETSHRPHVWYFTGRSIGH